MPDTAPPDTRDAADLLRRIIAEVRGETPYRYTMRYTRTLATVPPDRPALMSGFPPRDTPGPTTYDWQVTAERENSRRVRIEVTRPAEIHTPADQRASFVVVAHDDDAFYSIDAQHWGSLAPSQAAYASQLPLMMTAFDDVVDEATASAALDADGHTDVAGRMGESFRRTVARLAAYDQPRLLNAVEAGDGRYQLRVSGDDPQTLRERVYLTAILGRREIAELAGSGGDIDEIERRIPPDFRQRFHLEIEFAPTDFGEPIEVARPEVDHRMPAASTINEVPEYNPVGYLREPVAALSADRGASWEDLEDAERDGLHEPHGDERAPLIAAAGEITSGDGTDLRSPGDEDIERDQGAVRDGL